MDIMKAFFPMLILLFLISCNNNKTSSTEIPEDYKNTIWEPLAIRLAEGNNPSQMEIDSFSKKPQYRKDFYYLLSDFNKENYFPKEYITFEKAAESDLVSWLLYPTELDTIPSAIALLSKEQVQDADTSFIYYVFKFKTEPPHWAAKDGWMVGCVGPFKTKDNPYTWASGTFSRFKSVDSVSTKEEALWCHLNVYKRKE